MIIIHSLVSIRAIAIRLQRFLRANGFASRKRVLSSGFSKRANAAIPKAEKAKTHKRIVPIALKRFRENGIAGIGIADLMKEAGLTVVGTSNRAMT